MLWSFKQWAGKARQLDLVKKQERIVPGVSKLRNILLSKLSKRYEALAAMRHKAKLAETLATILQKSM